MAWQKTVAAWMVLGPAFLALGQPCPTVAVIIPEMVVVERIPSSIPSPVAEATLIDYLQSYGLRALDLRHDTALVERAAGFDGVASLAKRAYAGDGTAVRTLGIQGDVSAEVVVVGEAVAMVVPPGPSAVPAQPPMHSSQAVVEVRAIEVWTGRVVASVTLDAGGIGLTPELAGRSALARAGRAIACQLAQAIADEHPLSSCFRGCAPPAPVIGVLPLLIEDPALEHGEEFGPVLAKAVERAVSRRGCAVVQGWDADHVLAVTITRWTEERTPAFNVPELGWLWQRVEVGVTVDVRVLDVTTLEWGSHEVRVNVRGSEFLGLRFRATGEDVAEAVGREIACLVAP